MTVAVTVTFVGLAVFVTDTAVSMTVSGAVEASYR